jgi:hypothetical protein
MISDFKDFKISNGFEINDYYRGKNLEDLTVEELAYVHLNSLTGNQILKNGRLSTCLYDLIETVSASFNNVRTKQYVPLLGCFSILDQVGGMYGRADKTTTYGNGIKRALDLYSSVYSSVDLESLITLRHGVFHDGSLIGINIHTGTKVVFRMVIDSGVLLTPPTSEWDGVYRNDMNDYVTKIDLKELQKLTNEVIDECRKVLLEGNSDINTGDPKELFFKYLFFRQPQQGAAH